MSDLVSRLRDLSACKHDDLSIGNEAADRIETLERELAEARREADKWANLAAASESVAVKTHLEAQKAQEELEEARTDAQRYRLIRDNFPSLLLWDGWPTPLPDGALTAEFVDAAVDDLKKARGA